MTAGAMVPFEIEMLDPVCGLLPQNLGNSRLSRIVDDRRFAEAVYKVASQAASWIAWHILISRIGSDLAKR